MKPTVWRDAVRDSELEWVAKATLMTLSTYMNGRAEAWPSKEALAAGSGLSKRAVDEAVKRAEVAGYLVVSRSRGRSSNRYLGAIPNRAQPAGSTLHDVHGLDESNPVGEDSQPCTNPAPGASNPARGAPESGLKARRRGEGEGLDWRTDEEELSCDQCGEPKKVAKWPDGKSLCAECGRAKFAAVGHEFGLPL